MQTDNITLARIQTLHPSLRNEAGLIYDEICNVLTKNVICRFAHTLRTNEEQNELYAQGRTKLFDKNGKRLGIVTNAKGGQSYHNYGMACFSEDTRIFTNQGLKHFYELDGSEEVLTWKNNNLEFQKPNSYISNDYEGEMIHINTRSVDLLVTPNHKMVAKRKTNSNWSDDWQEIPASDIDYKYKIPTSGNSIHNENNLPLFANYNRILKIEDSKDWWEFMGYWLSEGSACGTSDGIARTHSSRYAVKISQVREKNPIVWEKIKKCLDRLDFTYSYQGHDFVIHNKSLWEILFKIGNSYNKHIPKYLLKADRCHLEKLYFALVDGDGSYYDNGEAYFSVSKNLAEDFLTLSILLNKSASLSSRFPNENSILPHGNIQKSPQKLQYQVRTRINTEQELRNGADNYKNIYKEYYKGVVYCVNTKAGAIVVERNGKVCIAGNCDIVLLIDKDGNGTYEAASWDTKADSDKDTIADWEEITKIFVKYGWQFLTKNGKRWDYPHFQKTFGLTVRDLAKKPKIAGTVYPQI